MTAYASALRPSAFIESAQDAAGFWQIGILWSVLATGIKTGNALCFLDETVGETPGGPVTHAHPMEEGLYIIDGQCTVHAGGETFVARPGSFVMIPRYAPHAFMAEAGARLLNFYLPAGFELLLMGLAAPAERKEPPRESDAVRMPPRALVEKLSADYGQIPILGLPFADPPDPRKMVTEPLEPTAAQPYLAHRDTAPAYWSQDILWSVLASGQSTRGSYTLLEELCPLGSGAPPHVHDYADEVFYILDGEAEFIAGDRRSVAIKGDLVFIPRGSVHTFVVRSDTARLLNLYTDAGFERVVEATGQKTNQLTLPPSGLKPSHSLSPTQMSQLFLEVGMQGVDLPSPWH